MAFLTLSLYSLTLFVGESELYAKHWSLAAAGIRVVEKENPRYPSMHDTTHF